MNKTEFGYHQNSKGKLRRGPSSFWMHDPGVVFDNLALKQGASFLDLGCGPGEYSIHAAGVVGDSGVVYALEKWAYMIDGLKEEAVDRDIRNINPITADITEPLPIHDQSIDVCLLSTVLHIFKLSNIEKILFTEIHRVLKPGGRVAIIECKKENQPCGPPKHMRLSPEELEASIIKYGFRKLGLKDLGYNYLIQYNIERSESRRDRP